ncbi:hypothetical protein [Yoonia litorea]|uniref:Uncharacterized protein n=1 Tax=Yoonia litorea TaxID=1123755 RepID=A0A1I6MWN1_9RHOB|nr:hypothetical protein [Yoonia litorea]SFS20079.1 hypothetical protein SAMN05444714_2471 [Yoonia litorea]
MSSKTLAKYDNAFSTRGNAIGQKRMDAQKGRIQNVLGTKGPFTDEFKSLVLSDYLNIMSSPYLAKELKGAKMVLRALSEDRHSPEAQDLFDRMSGDFVERNEPCMLCPIWRHEEAIRILSALALRYCFEDVRDELFFATIVFGFADNLESLEVLIEDTRQQLADVQKAMTMQRRGLVLAGAFEPDLRSPEQLRDMKLLSALSQELSWGVASHGGWVLTGHFIGRAPYRREFEALCRKTWPSRNDRRVDFAPLHKEKAITESLAELVSYLFKFEQTLFNTSGTRKNGSPRSFRSVQNAFHGPTLDTRKAVPKGFDRKAAIRQWALFVDRLGPDRLLYSVETAHAQKWYSESEMAYFRRAEDFDMINGAHRIEVHRDTGPHDQSIDPEKKHRVPIRRTRKLRFDEDWYNRTDIPDVDPFTHAVAIML